MKPVIECHPVNGWKYKNPNNTILKFQRECLKWLTGKYFSEYQAVLIDSATNALDLVLNYNKNILCSKVENVSIPSRTYVSIYIKCLDYYKNVKTTEYKWKDFYRIQNTNVVDSAGYFPKGKLDEIFNSSKGIEFVIFSFGNAKPLAMNKGGLIVFKKGNIPNTGISKYDYFKRMSHDGRDSSIPVSEDKLLKVNGRVQGCKYNLVPEQVKIGLKKLQHKDIRSELELPYSYKKYPNLKNI